jgi:hypothetical protein
MTPVIGNDDLGHPTEKRPRRPEADDDRRQIVTAGQVDMGVQL